MPMLTAVFGTTHHVSAAQEAARALLIFAYGLLLVRVAGRRVFGKWAALDIIVSVIIGSSLSRALTGSTPLVPAMAGAAALIATHWVLAALAARVGKLAYVVEGPAVTLGRHGRVDPHLRRWHAVTEADLDEALRQSGVERAEQTSEIVLEPSGRITVIQ